MKQIILSIGFIFLFNFSFSQKPVFLFGINGGLTVSSLKDTSLGLNNSALPHYGVNASFVLKSKYRLNVGIHNSFRGGNRINPVLKYRLNYFDFRLMPYYEVLNGLRIGIGGQYSLLYSQYYKKLNGTFDTGEEVVKIHNYHSNPEFMAGIEIQLEKNVILNFLYTLPFKYLEYRQFNVGISLNINNNPDKPEKYQCNSMAEALKNPAKVTKLVLQRQGLKEVPPEIVKLINLRELVLDGNEITTLPEEIGLLTKLEKISAGYNQIEAIPASIGNLINLQHLYLNDNKLKFLPSQIGLLYNLRFFIISNNDLGSIPPEIGNLTNLIEFNVSRAGQLLKIPNEICNLKKLEYLYIDPTTILPPSYISINPRLKIINQ